MRKPTTWKRLATGAALFAGLATAACNGSTVPFEAQQSGSLGVDQESGLLYAADLDNGGVVVVDPNAKGDNVVAFVKTGDRPERVIVRDGSVFVANRRSRTVTQLRASDHTVLRQIAVGAEPMGMQVASGNLLVANSMSGSVQAISLKDFTTKWESKLDDEVRAIAVLPDGRVYAPGYKSGRMHVLDGAAGGQLKEFSFAQPVDAAVSFDRRPTNVQDIVFADGKAYLAHSQTNKDALPPVVAGYYSAGPAPAVSPGISTIAEDDAVIVEKQPELFTLPDPSSTPFPPVMFSPTETFSGPKVAILDASGQYLYVVNHFSNNVAIVSTERKQPRSAPPSSGFGISLGDQGVSQLIPVGRGPTGIAISPDQDAAYVYNAYDHSISVIQPSSDDGVLIVTRELSQLTPQTLTEKQRLGRELFNDASDTRLTLTAAGGVACASCHPDAREDGHNWQFAEGTRNTPALAGKSLKKTKPYHWDGQFTEFEGFKHVLQKRMGGTGLAVDEFNAILEFLDNEPEPDNPNRLPDGALTDLQAQGKELFEGRANCASCHAGEILTDNKFYDIDTALTKIPIEFDATPSIDPSMRVPTMVNTPSLRGIFASAPYLHDGSAATLEDRVNINLNNKHGDTKDLTAEEKTALVAYLKTL